MGGLKRRLQPLWKFCIFRKFDWLNNAINNLRRERVQLVFLSGLKSTIFLNADLKILFGAKEFRFYMKNIQDFKIIPKISRKWKSVTKLERVCQNMRKWYCKLVMTVHFWFFLIIAIYFRSHRWRQLSLASFTHWVILSLSQPNRTNHFTNVDVDRTIISWAYLYDINHKGPQNATKMLYSKIIGN